MATRARIRVQIAGAEAIESAAHAFSEVIAAETLAESISVGAELSDMGSAVSVEVDGHAFHVAIAVAH